MSEGTYRIVGEQEGEPTAGGLSYVAPMAKTLVGKGVGHVATFNGRAFEITEIQK